MKIYSENDRPINPNLLERTVPIERLEIIPTTDIKTDPVLEVAFHALAGQLGASSRRQYQSDAKHFALWLSQHALTLDKVSRDDFIEYRRHLSENYPVAATASRLLVVAKRLLDEGVKRGSLPANPAADIKGFKAGGDNETTHTAFTLAQTKALLESVDQTTALGTRDYALLIVLVFTGMCRTHSR